MNNLIKKKAIVHGECFLYESEVPQGAKVKRVRAPHLIVADSETTGNHHVVDKACGVTFYEHGGRLFMRNTKPTKIRCVIETRHSSITINPGNWEFGTQIEHDPFEQNMRKIRD